ncbi:MAG: beta-lactamase family protein [Rhodospirillales bacterium]|nr:serine hydrolase [Rhodospirillales bacterium]MDE2197508.1 beta-lactamase family protein [Rhodospirillales bacterium]MDE2575709.1 beta-lactamase family protein [Rhodospirillales bacterium]
MPDLDLLRLERIAEGLIAPFDRPDTPGVALGVVRDGALVVHRQAGMASLEMGVPLASGSVFRIASVSKQFTCAAILMLAAEGRLHVADKVQDHLPELPDFGATITIDHLMHNTSGLRDMLEIMRLGGCDLSMPCRPADLLAGICRQRGLNFAPGARYLYSNTNFLLLGLIAERVSGMALPAFLQARIFGPLGMTRTAMVESTNVVVPGLVTGYLPAEGGGWSRAAHGFPLGGEGGLVSSVEDLALWVRHISAGHSAALASELERLAPFGNGLPNTYARGLQVREYRGLRAIDHGGLWPGYKTEFLRAPAAGLAVICIANNGTADPWHIAHAMLDAALDGRADLGPVPVTPVSAEFAPLAGRYIDRVGGATLDLSLADGMPTGCTHGVPFQLRQTADGRLRASRSAADFTMRASTGAAGTVLEVEADAGVSATYHPVQAGAALPAGLAGAYRSDEIGAVWRFVAQGQAMGVEVSGPLVRGAVFDVEAIEGDDVRVNVPSALFRSWLDVRVARAGDGTVSGLMVDGGRARGLRFTRIEGAAP